MKFFIVVIKENNKKYLDGGIIYRKKSDANGKILKDFKKLKKNIRYEEEGIITKIELLHFNETASTLTYIENYGGDKTHVCLYVKEYEI